MDPGSDAGNSGLDCIRDLCEELSGTLVNGDVLALDAVVVSAGNGVIVTVIGFEGGD